MIRYLAPLALLAISACADTKKSYESEPVVIRSEAGNVTCQLYRPGTVLWDKAIAKPPSMSDADANRHCRAEGELRKGNTATAKQGDSIQAL